jgi:hypothetical protein
MFCRERGERESPLSERNPDSGSPESPIAHTCCSTTLRVRLLLLLHLGVIRLGVGGFDYAERVWDAADFGWGRAGPRFHVNVYSPYAYRRHEWSWHTQSALIFTHTLHFHILTTGPSTVIVWASGRRSTCMCVQCTRVICL